MKQIKRMWATEDQGKLTIQGVAMFEATGSFSNGNLAYSMLDQEGNEIKGHEGSFIQYRINNKMVMVRI